MDKSEGAILLDESPSELTVRDDDGGFQEDTNQHTPTTRPLSSRVPPRPPTVLTQVIPTI